MKKGMGVFIGTIFLTLIFLSFMVPATRAADPIIIGVPTSLGFLEGKESVNAAQMAVEEINAKGGVKVGAVKRPLKLEPIDIRDAAPGVPVPEALLGIEKIILEKKPAAIVVGPFRSEALLAGMDIVSKYKVPLLATIAMAPDYGKKVLENPDKYKYCFRVCLDAVYLIQYLRGTMEFLGKSFGFNKVFIMHQDVAWARGTGKLMEGWFKQAGWSVVGMEAYPTGSSDFSAGLMKVQASGAQVILPIFDMPQSGILVKQGNAMKVPAIMAGFISPLAGPGAWKTFEGKIEKALNAIFEVGNIPVKKIPPSVAFFNNYKKRFNVDLESGHGPAPAYESVYLLAEAIERAGTLEPDALVAALEKSDRNGAMGRIRFGKNHQVVYGFDPKETALGCVYQWEKPGIRQIVFPESIAEGKIELPEWVKPAK
jgi:branched-chain amino acid transport system substrate-binding protein